MMKNEASDGESGNCQPTEGELWRRVTEARAWLRDGYTSAEKVDELIGRIAKKRGQAAADRLRSDMREQWRCREDWLA